MIQFQNQFDAVESATPLDRMGNWNSSPMTTQPAGPQVTCAALVKELARERRRAYRKEEDVKADKYDQAIVGGLGRWC